MSRSQIYSLGRGWSAGSTRGSRPPTSHPKYRSILRNNDVYMDHTAVKIPQELRSFFDSEILKDRGHGWGYLASGEPGSGQRRLLWLFSEAYASEDQPSVVDSIAFSTCVTYREVVLHVHHYSVAEDRYYLSSLGTFQTTNIHQVQAYNNIVQNIFEHGLETRQRKT
ncbi:hypothetical protein GX50_03789 [[Emmonsia] crescens]|uniref:Uncharacterized protein n=1 Tax=[Emmonsia] crescens TaxID=73230 RepID=A0A2B7ZJ75_9EURO|nr:hypothetical protein GX50_03789 [Emmonsia crescens]